MVGLVAKELPPGRGSRYVRQLARDGCGSDWPTVVPRDDAATRNGVHEVVANWCADGLLTASYFTYRSYLEGLFLPRIKADLSYAICSEVQQMLFLLITQNDVDPHLLKRLTGLSVYDSYRDRLCKRRSRYYTPEQDQNTGRSPWPKLSHTSLSVIPWKRSFHQLRPIRAGGSGEVAENTDFQGCRKRR